MSCFVARDRDEVGRLREVAVQPAPHVAERLAVGVAGALLGSSVQMCASESGGATRGSRRSISSIVGGSIGSRGGAPKRAAIVSPIFSCCSRVGPAPSTPQPQNRRLLAVVGSCGAQSSVAERRRRACRRTPGAARRCRPRG